MQFFIPSNKLYYGMQSPCQYYCDDNDYLRAKFIQQRRQAELEKEEYMRKREYLQQKSQRNLKARELLEKEKQQLLLAQKEAEEAKELYLKEQEMYYQQEKGLEMSVDKEETEHDNEKDEANEDAKEPETPIEQTCQEKADSDANEKESVMKIENWWSNILQTKKDQSALKQLKSLKLLHSNLENMKSKINHLVLEDNNGNQLVFVGPSLASGTSANRPFMEAEEQLLRLLTQLDSVLSYGSEQVRECRKQLVNKAQEMLKQLDVFKQEQFEKQSSSSSSSSETDVEIEYDGEYAQKPETLKKKNKKRHSRQKRQKKQEATADAHSLDTIPFFMSSKNSGNFYFPVRRPFYVY